MNYANIKFNDIANGEGVRVSLFVAAAPIIAKTALTKKLGTLITENLSQKKLKT